ncbi:MAG: sigma-70 family RNA polymerase sigma factor [Planctomycetes bacterium]|nr:sigma-70 family RNA polymerase sigma factor [Planctomycetota bacterium]
MSDALRFVESCIDRYAEQAWRTAYVMLSNAADADDLLQQAFLVAWRKAANAPRDNAWPWLAAIIAHEARNFRRKRSRRRAASLDSVNEPAMEHDPDKQLQRAELSALVHVSLAELSDDQRLAIVLTHLSGLSQSQAADALGVPLNTLKARVRRGLETMREALGKSAPSLEGTLKNLPVAPPAGGLIAAKAAWTASLSGNVAAAGTATAAGATVSVKLLVAASVTALVLAAGISGAALAPDKKPKPYVAADLPIDHPKSSNNAPKASPQPAKSPAPVIEPQPAASTDPKPVPPQQQPVLPVQPTSPDPQPYDPLEHASSTVIEEPAPLPFRFEGPGQKSDDWGGKRANPDFWKVWLDKKATVTQKLEVVVNLMVGFDEYTEVLESDVCQFREIAVRRLQNEQNKKLLELLEEFLFDSKEVWKRPAAGEHVLWALYNNENWVTPAKWSRSAELVTDKKVPENVKARMLRELGVFRGEVDNDDSQAQAKANVRTLVGLLEWCAGQKKFSPVLRYLMGDALESLSSQDFGDDLAKWRFFADNLNAPLKPRSAERFLDQFTDVQLEGRTFASPTQRPTDTEVLVLPDIGCSDRYWYPYVFELNKTFKCTLLELPDCSRMKDIQWMKNRDDTASHSTYYFPLKQFVEVLEERRIQSKQPQIGLIAHGASGWIALEYLRLHPESVAFAVIVGTWSGERSREAGRNAMEQSKDEAFKFYAQDLVYDPSGRVGSLSLNEEQKFWAKTGEYKRRWAEPRALEPIFYAQLPWQNRPVSKPTLLVPNYEFEDEMEGKPTIDVPVLFVHGAQDPMFVKKDETVYKKVFPLMRWEVYESSAGTPWAEEPIRFMDDIRTMLDKNDIPHKLKKDKNGD